MESYLFPELKEPVEHGTVLLPYRSFLYSAKNGIPDVLLHWHEEAEINFVRRGAATYQSDNELIEAKPGDIIFVAPGTLHAVRTAPGQSVETDVLIFHPNMLGAASVDQCSLSFLRPLINGSCKPASVIHTDCPSYDEVADCLNQMFGCLKAKESFLELHLRELLFHFLLLLYQKDFIHEVKAGSRLRNTVQIKTALNYIQQHYSEAISIAELAELCHFSEPYFMSFFKQSVGLSCMDYILRLRLKTAEMNLRTTDKSISEIALECGYHNLANFNRQFKRMYHLTPREYKKR